MSEELLRVAEELADAVEHHLEDGEPRLTQRPLRSEYDEGEDGQQEFKEALELWEYDCELIKTALERALRNYRRVEERDVCQRAMANCSPSNGTAARGKPETQQSAQTRGERKSEMSKTKLGRDDPEFTQIVDDLLAHVRRQVLGWPLKPRNTDAASVFAEAGFHGEGAKDNAEAAFNMLRDNTALSVLGSQFRLADGARDMLLTLATFDRHVRPEHRFGTEQHQIAAHVAAASVN